MSSQHISGGFMQAAGMHSVMQHMPAAVLKHMRSNPVHFLMYLVPMYIITKQVTGPCPCT